MNAGTRISRALLVLLAAAMSAACGGGTSTSRAPETAPPPSVERHLSPAEIDPRVDTATQDHIAINPSPDVPTANRLFVFLPGTQGVPSLYREILRVGAARGYHVIGLNYPNAIAVGQLCLGEDPSCFWDVRREVVTGVDLSPLVEVNAANAIDSRLAQAVAHLNSLHPDEGWGTYLSGNDIVWSSVVVAGHSQGGGHAGVIAKLRPLARAAYFAAPPDWLIGEDRPAAWLSFNGQTPASRQFGFGHVDDGLVPHAQTLESWRALGLAAFGAAVSVDGASAPFGDSHMLSTSAAPGDDGFSVSPTHGAPVLDAVTPVDSTGAPLYSGVWIYMAFP